jgi:hypothetical protein
MVTFKTPIGIIEGRPERQGTRKVGFEDDRLKVKITSEIKGRADGAVPCGDRLGGHRWLAFGVNEFRIKIDPAIPFNRIEGNPNLPEILIVLDSPEYAEIKNRFQIQDALFAVFKNDEKGIIILRNNFFYRKVHRPPPY